MNFGLAISACSVETFQKLQKLDAKSPHLGGLLFIARDAVLAILNVDNIEVLKVDNVLGVLNNGSARAQYVTCRAQIRQPIYGTYEASEARKNSIASSPS